MPPPSRPPVDSSLWWTSESKDQSVQLSLNAGSKESPAWRKCILELPKDTREPKGLNVLARDSSAGRLFRFTLSLWVNIYKPTLRGNAKDAWFFSKDDNRYHRLQHLWELLQSVPVPCKDADFWHRAQIESVSPFPGTCCISTVNAISQVVNTSTYISIAHFPAKLVARLMRAPSLDSNHTVHC